jgi:hypothetical protein
MSGGANARSGWPLPGGSGHGRLRQPANRAFQISSQGHCRAHPSVTSVPEREVQSEFALEGSCRIELLLGVVDPHYARTASREPRRHIGGPAPKLDRVEAAQVSRQHL